MEQNITKPNSRNSFQKSIILEVLKENVVHPDADYLYQKIREKYPTIGMATVYRNLNRMAQEGTIKRIDGLSPRTHYDHNTHKHYHFICTKCGRVYDVSSSVAPDVLQNAQRETGFEILNYDITFSGICKKCKGEKNDN